MRVLSTVQLGDLPGHDFHGNQWTGGSGSADALIAASPRQPGEDSFAWQARIIKGLPEQQQSDILFKVRETYPAVPFVAAGIQTWCSEHGLPTPPENCNQIPVNQKEADAVAAYFEKTPDQSGDPRVQAAYEDFKAQSAEMYSFLTKPEDQGGLGVKVEFTNKVNPYPDAASQAADLRDNHHFFIESGLGGAHEATMTQRQYDEFRAVHDVFGHAGIGGGFDRHGEYQAWLVHSSMYTGAGRDAMSTEYHGVNSAAWTGEPGTPGTGKSLLLPEKWASPPWDRPVTASAGLDLDELIDKLGLDAKFARDYDVLPWHPIENRPVISAAFALELGDVAGHDFHGNQWTGGVLSSEDRSDKYGSTPPEVRRAFQAIYPNATVGSIRNWKTREGRDENGLQRPFDKSYTHAYITAFAQAQDELAKKFPEVAANVTEVKFISGNFAAQTGWTKNGEYVVQINPSTLGGFGNPTGSAASVGDHEVGYKMSLEATERYGYATGVHEFGHLLDYSATRVAMGDSASWSGAKETLNSPTRVPGGLPSAGDFGGVSNYAQKNTREGVAEAFTAVQLGTTLSGKPPTSTVRDFVDRFVTAAKSFTRTDAVLLSSAAEDDDVIWMTDDFGPDSVVWKYADFPSITAAAFSLEFDFNPDQERNEKGEWTSSGGEPRLAPIEGSRGNPLPFESATMTGLPKELQARVMATVRDRVASPQKINSSFDHYMAVAWKDPSIKEAGMKWYQQQHDAAFEIAKQNGLQPQNVAAAMAAMSPGTQWAIEEPIIRNMASMDHENVQLSPEKLDLLNQKMDGFGLPNVKNGQPYSEMDSRSAVITMQSQFMEQGRGTWGVGYGWGGFAKGLDLMRGANVDDTLPGVKVRSFTNNIMDPTDNRDVTIDIHMVQGAARDPNVVNDSGVMSAPSYKTANIGAYPYVADVVRRVATDYGVRPNQAQALIWLGYKAEFGNAAPGEGKK